MSVAVLPLIPSLRDGMKLNQCRKCRSPVNTIASPRSLAAAMTSSSRTEPPGQSVYPAAQQRDRWLHRASRHERRGVAADPVAARRDETESVPEVPLPREHHRQLSLVGGGDDLLVAHRATRSVSLSRCAVAGSLVAPRITS